MFAAGDFLGCLFSLSASRLRFVLWRPHHGLRLVVRCAHREPADVFLALVRDVVETLLLHRLICVCFLLSYSSSGERREGGGTHVVHGRSRMTKDPRLSNAGTDHVGFSPTMQILLAPRTFLHMDDRIQLIY